MQISRRNKSGQGTIGLDIDGAYLAAVRSRTAVSRTRRASPSSRASSVDGEVADDDRLVEALKDFVHDHNLPRNVRLGVGNQQIVVRHLDLPKINDRAERETAVRFQAAEAMPMPLDDAVVDYSVVGEHTTEEGAPRERVVVVAARRSMITSYVDPVRRAGLKPEGIDLDAFALVRVLGDPTDAEAMARVCCHLGGITNLAVAKGNVCLFTRPLSTPWQGERADVDALAEEIRISIDYYLGQPDSQPVGEILLSGAGAEDAELVARLNELMTLPVSAAPRWAACPPTACRSERRRTATPSPSGWRWERRHEARQPSSRRPSAAAAPAARCSGSSYAVVGVLGALFLMVVVLRADRQPGQLPHDRHRRGRSRRPRRPRLGPPRSRPTSSSRRSRPRASRP